MENVVREFFRQVLSDKGFCVLVSFAKGEAPRTQVCETIDHLCELVGQPVQDMYFCISTLKQRSYKTPDGKKHSRIGSNCLETKSLVLDIDLDPSGFLKGKQDKPCFTSHQEAYDAVANLCEVLHLPVPYVVNSGYGLHVYWPFEDAVDSVTWSEIANNFRYACAHVNPKITVDPTRIADRAGVLRVPGTTNFKNPESPKEVKILNVCSAELWPSKWYVEHISQYIVDNNIEVGRKSLPHSGEKPIVDLSLDSDTLEKADFREVYKRCNWVAHHMKNAHTSDEPIWWRMIGLSAHCYLDTKEGVRLEDADLAKYVSKTHPSYKPEETIAKWGEAVGKYKETAFTCENLQSIDRHPCKGCKYAALVKTPLMTPLAALPVENIEIERPVIISGSQIGIQKYELPKPPFPFVIGDDGGIYKRVKDTEDASRFTSQLIYEYTLLPVARICDESTGLESVEFEVRLPQENTRKFVLPSGLLMDGRYFAKELAQRGVYVLPKVMSELMEYLIKYVQILQKHDPSLSSYSSFGWKDLDTTIPKFVVSDKVFTKVDVRPFRNMPKNMESQAMFVSSTGELDAWKQAFNIYTDIPGMEPHVVNLMLAFGCPLLHFLNQQGFVFNLTGPTGHGKSSSLILASSVWGMPTATHITMQDTGNALYTKLGIFNTIPIAYDEITTIDPKQLSELSYTISLGKGRDSLTRDRQLRVDPPKWQTIMLSTSNVSLYTKLSTLPMGNNAQAYRILEYEAPAKNGTINGRMLRAKEIIAKNYGLAGRVYIEYIMQNYEAVGSKVRDAYRNLSDKDRSKERFWDTAKAIIQVGGYISKELGLHDYEPGKLLEFMRDSTPTERVESLIGDPISKLNEYILQNIPNTIKEFDDKVVNLELEFKGMPNISLRLEGHKGVVERALVPVSTFKQWCDRNNIDFAWMKTELTNAGILTRTYKKRIGAGTKYFSIAALCWELDMTHALVVGHEKLQDNVIKLAI